MTTKQKEIAKFLESLVFNKFSKEMLNKKISDFFKEYIELEEVTYDDRDDIPMDWNLMFESTNINTSGFFDIYVLKLRENNATGLDYYITEVSYEFN